MTTLSRTKKNFVKNFTASYATARSYGSLTGSCAADLTLTGGVFESGAKERENSKCAVNCCAAVILAANRAR